jgi:hypothetical protein
MSVAMNDGVALDKLGKPVQAGDYVRVLAITPDPDMDEDDVDMVDFMIGSICEIDRVDAAGLVWVTMWWNCGEGTATSSVGLARHEFEKVNKPGT